MRPDRLMGITVVCALVGLAVTARSHGPKAPVGQKYALLVGVPQMPVLRGESAGLAALVGERATKEPMPRSGRPGDAGRELPARASPSTTPRPIQSRERVKTITSTTGMKLVLVPAGEFEMGSSAEDTVAGDDEKPRHRVRISRPFYLGACEVTQAEYEQVMGKNPSW